MSYANRLNPKAVGDLSALALVIPPGALHIE